MLPEVMTHGGKEAVGREMHRAVRLYSSDLGRYTEMSKRGFFDMVRKIPYSDDESLFGDESIELTPGPKTILAMPAIDCKKKAILVASWARENSVPYRFVAVCEDGSGIAHHVFPQLMNCGEWETADATFPSYEYNEPKTLVTHAWILGE